MQAVFRQWRTAASASVLALHGARRFWLACGLMAGGWCVALPGFTQGLPSYAQVRAGHVASDTDFLSREGEWLQRLRIDHRVRQGAWIGLDAISPALRQALVYSEDQRFYAHSGVDWQAVSAAAWGNLWNTRTRGASTITMQLAGLLDEEWRRGAQGRSVVQKMGQAVAARRLERTWRKDQILEAYLNLVPFRGELVGIDALSRTLFGKAPHGLDQREAAVAAALVRAPNAAPERVAQRACGVWRALRNQQGIDCEALDFFTEAALQRRSWSASAGVAPHYARQWLRQYERQNAQPPDALIDSKGDRSENTHWPAQVRTTLSAPLQRLALELLQQHLRELDGRQVEDGAVLVLDNATGEVLAWVGSSGAALSRAHEVDGVLALRQPGSTLKPFLYAQAIAQRRLTAASLIEDSPAHIPTAAGLYVPQNYDRSFKGWVSVRTALAASLNVPAVRTLAMVGPDAFFEQLQAFGLPLRESGGYYGFSLALGSSEVSLLNLTNAYRALANGGRYQAVAWNLVNSQNANPAREFFSVMDPGAAFIVGDVLSDGNARALTFGTDSVLATRVWTAVKTGTSKDMRDNWVVGWSQRYTVGVWVGNVSGAPMHAVSGADGAAPIWASLIRALHARESSQPPSPPQGLTSVAVQFGLRQDHTALPLEASRKEWFLSGTEQSIFALASVAKSSLSSQQGMAVTRPRIQSPVNGTVVALDPDIPPAYQRLRLAADQSKPGMVWHVGRTRIAQGRSALWFPVPGIHQLELRGPDGKVWDQIRLEVRGAGVVQPPSPS